MKIKTLCSLLILISLVSCSPKNTDNMVLFKEAVMQNDREKADGLFLEMQNIRKYRRELFFNYALFLIHQKDNVSDEQPSVSPDVNAAGDSEDMKTAEKVLERLLQLYPDHEEASKSLEYLRRLRFEEKLQEELKQDLEDMQKQQDQAQSRQDQENLSDKAEDWQDKASESQKKETQEASEKMSEIQKKMDEASKMKEEGLQQEFEEKQQEIQKDLQQMADSLNQSEKDMSGENPSPSESEATEAENIDNSRTEEEMEDILSQEKNNPESNQNNESEDDTVNYRNW